MAACNQIAKISREELLEFVRNELICTIGSADAPVTIPVLITTFREDTNEDVLEMAKKLGHPSIEAMLESKDCEDIVEPCYTDLAKGAGNEKPKKVFSYRVKNNPVIAHILTTIEESNKYKDSKQAEKQRKMEVLIGDPKYNPSILAGKERLLSLIHHLGGDYPDGNHVDLLELQKAYREVYEEDMNKMALKRFFPTGQLKSIMDRYLFQDVELATDQNRNGSLLFKLKRPFKEIKEEILRIATEREQHKKQEEMRKVMQVKKPKKPKGPATQPKKLRVIKPQPPPKPKPIPMVKSMIQRPSELYTCDPLLFHKITLAGEQVQKGEDEEEGTEGEEADDEWEIVEDEDNPPKVKYTTRVEGATYTDDEEDEGQEDDGEDEDEDEENDEDWKEELEEEKEEDDQDDTLEGEKRGGKGADEEKGTVEEQLAKKDEEQKRKKDGEGPSEKPESRAIQRLKMVQKKMIEQRKMAEQYLSGKKNGANQKPVEGVFEETERHGKRAKEEEARRERVAKLRARMAERMAEKELMVVDRMSENTKRRLAAMTVQLIWTNRELGLSEVKSQLELLFGCELVIDVAKFVAEYCKCVKSVRAPIEPHLIIMDGRKKEIDDQLVKQGKVAWQQWKQKGRLKKL